MLRFTRKWITALAFAAMLTSSVALPAAADMSLDGDLKAVPIGVDAFLLRPLGFITTIVGSGLFVAAAPLVLMTRPSEIGKPFRLLVVGPAKFTWVDPLGSH